MSDTPLIDRITAYLSCGGLFNPELANHDAVRDLLIDCRAALAAANERAREIRRAERERCAKVCEKRAAERFEEHGTREHDTNATYYGGRHGDMLASLDEEDDDCAAAIRSLDDEGGKGAGR